MYKLTFHEKFSKATAFCTVSGTKSFTSPLFNTKMPPNGQTK